MTWSSGPLPFHNFAASCLFSPSHVQRKVQWERVASTVLVHMGILEAPSNISGNYCLQGLGVIMVTFTVPIVSKQLDPPCLTRLLHWDVHHVAVYFCIGYKRCIGTVQYLCEAPLLGGIEPRLQILMLVRNCLASCISIGLSFDIFIALILLLF